MYKKILVPTDGSALSEQAVASAIEFARLCHADIVALSIAEPYPLAPAAEGAMVIDPAFEVDTLEQAARDAVAKVGQAVQAAGLNCSELTSSSMIPADDIVRIANEQGCDLIFMASHGRRGLSRLLAGSVTQHVLAYSSIPVMVLRPGPQGKLGAAVPPSTRAS